MCTCAPQDTTGSRRPPATTNKMAEKKRMSRSYTFRRMRIKESDQQHWDVHIRRLARPCIYPHDLDVHIFVEALEQRPKPAGRLIMDPWTCCNETHDLGTRNTVHGIRGVIQALIPRMESPVLRSWPLPTTRDTLRHAPVRGSGRHAYPRCGQTTRYRFAWE